MAVFKSLGERFNKEVGFFDVQGHRVKYSLYRAKDPSPTASRKLLMLHGAGVAGELTWEPIISFLEHWDEVLVPDFRGAGDTHHHQGVEAAYHINELCDDVIALVAHFAWNQLDLAGYSMGGLVSMLFKSRWQGQVDQQFLLESAGLERKDPDEAVQLREHYQTAVSALRLGDVSQGVTAFLDIISPKRRVSAAVEKVTIERLGHRPEGFAHALDAVTHSVKALNRDALIADQARLTSFVGANSLEGLHEYQTHIVDNHPSWQYISVPGTDHSLPYQKPRQIAVHMNKSIQG